MGTQEGPHSRPIHSESRAVPGSITGPLTLRPTEQEMQQNPALRQNCCLHQDTTSQGSRTLYTPSCVFLPMNEAEERSCVKGLQAFKKKHQPCEREPASTRRSRSRRTQRIRRITLQCSIFTSRRAVADPQQHDPAQ